MTVRSGLIRTQKNKYLNFIFRDHLSIPMLKLVNLKIKEHKGKKLALLLFCYIYILFLGGIYFRVFHICFLSLNCFLVTNKKEEVQYHHGINSNIRSATRVKRRNWAEDLPAVVFLLRETLQNLLRSRT